MLQSNRQLQIILSIYRICIYLYITKYIYDKNARLNSIVDPMGNITVLARDANGRVTTKTDANGNATKYQYDALGRIITATNPNSTLTFTYDTLGRVKTFTDGKLNKTIDYEYDKNGNRTKMTDPEGGITTYTYDNLNLLTSITNPSGKTFNLTYDALYRRTYMKYPNGITANYTYDAVSQITEITNNLNAAPITKNNYTYDNAENRLTNTDIKGTHNYQYDSLYQLTQATHPNIDTEAYTYDKNGNRITETKGQTTINYTHTAGNRIATRNGETYTHDKNGNITNITDSQGTTTFEYDNENRLIKATMPDGTIAVYKYDPLGRRIEKAVTENSTTTTTRYLYDGFNIIAEYDENNNVKAQYIQNLGIDDQLAMVKNGNTYFYHKDGLGSVVALSDSTGTVVQTYAYDSFGNITNQTGSISQPYTFTGREYDAETGLYHYRLRTYDQKTGTFTQKDPIGFAAGDMNLYGYVRNNPVNFVDPLGLKEWIFITGGGGGGIVPIAVEGGTYFFIDPSTGKYYQWAYGSLGVGLGFGGAAQIEGGTFEGPDDPCQMSAFSFTVSGFASAGKGVSTQVTGTSFWGHGESGGSAGFAAGAGAGVAGMLTYSYYLGQGDVLPEKYRSIYQKIFNKMMK